MKRKEIVVGGVYENPRSGRRRVLGMGPEFKVYPEQKDDDCLRYEVTSGPGMGLQHNQSCKSFASWAKTRTFELVLIGSKFQEFKDAAKPLRDWVEKNCNPHTKVIVDNESAEIVQGVAVYFANES